MGMSSLIGPMLGATSSTVLKSAFEQLEEPEDSLTVEQMISIGILKSHPELYKIETGVSKGISAFASDYETLRLEGFSSETAFEITRLIYCPRITLHQSKHLKPEFIQELGHEEVVAVVENSLCERLESEGISPGEDLLFDIGGIEESASVDEFLE